MGAVAVGAILIALLLVIAAGFAWQATRSTPEPADTLYLIDEAVRFVHGGLPEPDAERLTDADVRSMLEWSVYHGQVVVARNDEEIPVLGGPAAAEFVVSQGTAAGREWTAADVATVLELESAYLVSIGAVGEAVGEGSA